MPLHLWMGGIGAKVGDGRWNIALSRFDDVIADNPRPVNPEIFSHLLGTSRVPRPSQEHRRSGQKYDGSIHRAHLLTITDCVSLNVSPSIRRK